MNRNQKKHRLKDSPEKQANFFSKITFWWLKEIYILGTKRTIKPEDIYKEPIDLSSKINTNKFIKLWKKELERENPSLLRVLLKTYGAPLAFWGLCYSIVDITMRVTNSICLGGLVDYFVQEEHVSTENGLMYATGIMISLIISTASYHPYMGYVTNVGAHIKIGLTGLIYRKALRLPLSSTYQSVSGKVINIMADDVGQFDLTLSSLHNTWKGPIEFFIFGYFIHREIGYSGIAGMVLLLCFTPLQAILARKTAKNRNELSQSTDIRIRIMNEIVMGIRFIKMFGLEHVFEKVITKIRRKEIRMIQTCYKIRAILVSLSLLTRYSIFVSLVTYLYLGNTITPRNVFITFAFFNLLNWSMLWQWPFALIHYGQGYVAVKRIEAFLLIRETRNVLKSDCDDESSTKRIIHPKHESQCIILTNVTSKWMIRSNQSAGIYNLNLNISNCNLCAIVGSIGSGKSSLLYVITGELSVEQGQCEIYGKISYASQVPWIFEGTVRENILFTEQFEEEKYHRVIKVCCLLKDIMEMPYRDSTMVGECGFSLSGGQRSRISLARAIYKNADIYMLDDPLAGIDFNMANYIFNHCIRGYLKDRCCVLVTNEIQHLKYAQNLVVLQDGQIQIQGTFNEIQETNMLPFLNLASRHTKVDVDTEESKNTKSLVSLLTILEDEHYQSRRVEDQFIGSRIHVYIFYFLSVRSANFLAIVFFLFIAAHSLLSGVDFHISNWNVGATWELMTSTGKIKAFAETDEGINNSTITSLYIRTYCGLLGAGTFAYIYRTFTFFALCLRASISLHDDLFASIMRAKIVFFDTNPSGRILNRFSRDMIRIESEVPPALLELISFALEFLASIILVSIIVNSWMLIPAVCILAFFIFLRYVYTSTSRSIQRIDAISLSPLYTHVNNTLQGLSTIRVSNVQNILLEEFYDHLDFNSAVAKMKSSTYLAFSFWMDVACLVYIGICAFTFVLYRGDASSEIIGVALLHCINLIGMCQWVNSNNFTYFRVRIAYLKYGTRDTAEIEIEITSVERVTEYTKIPPEPQLECLDRQLLANWPTTGEIVFKNFYFKYANTSKTVLKNLNFKINGGEKIGIVGRTGAGKSSIAEAIFRMDEFDGEIIIDGIVTNTLGLHDLRKRISIITQNPVLFSGTLRFNLDPFDKVSDAEVWSALEQVEMKYFVQTLPEGLNYNLVKSGTNFSMGQRQLICLARAIIRNNKIVINDEATASVDPETDKLIQQTIKSNFSGCTVLTISHQLHNVMDSDRILVIDNGLVIEFDHPHILLSNSNGYLRLLLDQIDPSIAQMLTQIAKKSYDSSKTINRCLYGLPEDLPNTIKNNSFA